MVRLVAALDKPLVSIYSPTDSQRYGPYLISEHEGSPMDFHLHSPQTELFASEQLYQKHTDQPLTKPVDHASSATVVKTAPNSPTIKPSQNA
ncbi:MAG: hypothetical protein ACSW8C_00890 [bacterium]